MPVPEFDGDTFVAFIDIAGFKAMMADGNRALLALDAFYSAGYRVLDRHRNNDASNDGVIVDGIFVSDCGVLFVRGERGPNLPRLEQLCSVVQRIHQRTFESAVQLTTSIAWGKFSYQERIEFPGIEKNPIYGNAYLAAFIDNERGMPKLYPGECRLIRDDDLPPDVVNFCLAKRGAIASRMRETPNHFYYEWMRRNNRNSNV